MDKYDEDGMSLLFETASLHSLSHQHVLASSTRPTSPTSASAASRIAHQHAINVSLEAQSRLLERQVVLRIASTGGRIVQTRGLVRYEDVLTLRSHIEQMASVDLGPPADVAQATTCLTTRQGVQIGSDVLISALLTIGVADLEFFSYGVRAPLAPLLDE